MINLKPLFFALTLFGIPIAVAFFLTCLFITYVITFLEKLYYRWKNKEHEDNL